MALRGCISVRALPLQILLRENPSWVGTPVAVTKEERPQSPIIALNREAREKGLAAGMRYASALSLVPALRARAVPADKIFEARESIARFLSAFTPDIEPCPFDVDAFWVSVDGLRSLFASEARWIKSVEDALAAQGFRVNVVVGFTRFGTYAIARCRSRSRVFASPTDEQALMSRSPVDILPLSQRTKSTLRKLEVRTVQQFVSLPAGETVLRFGRDAGSLRAAILSDDPLPIQPVSLKESTPCRRRLDAPLVDLNLLMPHVEELLAGEAGRVEAEKSVISGLTLILRTEEGDVSTDVIRPAVPTLRLPLLRRLIHLRLSARQFQSGVVDIEIRCACARPSRRQEELFAVKGRDLQAGARAFAAIRARYGNDSVTSAHLRDSHLPERSFSWAPLSRPILPSRGPEGTGGFKAVRRILFTPARARPAQKDSADSHAFVVSGSWWGTEGEDAPYHRSYCFQESSAGTLWLFEDRLSGMSWLQGVVD